VQLISKPACIDNALCIHAATQTQKPARPNKVDQIKTNTSFRKLQSHKEMLVQIVVFYFAMKSRAASYHFFSIKITMSFDQHFF
jgi:hypothetical protein